MLRQQSFRGLAGLAATIALLTVGTEWAIGAGHGGGGGGHGGGGHGGFSGGHRGFSGGHRGGFNGGGFRGDSFRGNGFRGDGFRGDGFLRDGFRRDGFGRGFFGYGFGYGLGFYGSYFPYGYRYPYYAPPYGFSNGYSQYSASGYWDAQSPLYTATASAPPAPVDQAPAVPDTTAVFHLRVPADALVWFNDSKTEQTGAVRQFVSPRLAPVQAGVYDIRCRWEQNGRQMEQTRHVTVHAGDQLAINFLQ
jgi:uncharacterized protein (TIGR03000 family)